YVFLREAYGPALGFLFGWDLFLVVQTGTIAAVAIAFARFLGVFAPSIAGDHYLLAPIVLLPGYAVSLSTEQLVAILLIALLTFSNTRGLRVGKIVQNNFTFTKTAALIGAIIIGLIFGWKPNCAAPPEILTASQTRVAVAMMRAILGTPGVLPMAAAIMISTFGCNNGLILAGARVYCAMAGDNLFFHKVGTTNRCHVPAFALLVQAIWTALLTLPRTVTTNAQTGTPTFGN